MNYTPMPYYYQQGGTVPDQLTAFKQPYQTPYTTQMAPPAQPSQNSGPMLWVQGEAAAKSWAVAPGAAVVLWDAENPFIYIKSADMAGIPAMRTLRWEEVQPGEKEKNNTEDKKEYAHAEAVRSLEEKVNALAAQIDAMKRKHAKEE